METVIIYEPWSVSGELATAEDVPEVLWGERAWAIVTVSEDGEVQVFENDLTYYEAIGEPEPNELTQLVARAELSVDYEERDRLITEMGPLIRAQIEAALQQPDQDQPSHGGGSA